MALRDQKRLMAELDRMNGKRVAKIARSYRQNVIAPVVGRIKKAKSPKGLLKQLGPGLVKEMNAAALEDAIEDNQVQMACIGRATAMPGKRMKAEG